MIGIGHGRTYKVRIETLLGHLKRNRDEHVSIVEEAQAKFREMAIEKINLMLKDAMSGGNIKTSIGLTVPSIHTDAFDNAIGLMEMTMEAEETTIEIDAGEFDRFVRNKWDWSRDFNASNRAYSGRV